MALFQKWLEKNRNKTEAEKKSIALMISFLITSIIVLVWIFTLFNTFGAGTVAETASRENAASPVEAGLSLIKSTFSGVSKFKIDY